MRGIVAGGSQQTVDAGAQILRQGGNAVDAAIAAAAASYTGEIMLASPGGGGFATLKQPGQPPVVYDFFVNTPGLGEDRRGTGDLDFTPITVVYESGTSVYHLGHASSAVPGDIAGFAQILDDAGTMPLADVLQPAIRLAREGITLNRYQAYLIRLVDVIFDYDESCRRLYAPHGDWLPEGDHFASPELAHTLERIAQDGWRTFYSGELARIIADDQTTRGGLITADDLAAYRVIKRDPLRFAYKSHTIFTNPPPSSGGILIAYALALLGRADLSDLVHGDADHNALLAEIQRQVALARLRDDPAAMRESAAWVRWLSGPHVDTDWTAAEAAYRAGRARHGPGLHPPMHSSTTHISAIDETGLAVGLTTTCGESAGYAVHGTGIVMNNMLGEEELNPGGFHSYTPGTRLSSMMSPTVVSDADGMTLVLGSGGAARLRDAIFQMLSNTLDWSLPVADAVTAPRVHFDGTTLHLEGGYDAAAADELEARGYAVSRWPDIAFYYGGTHAARRDPDGTFSGAGDPRRGGAVAVVD